jgi:hypothetical protein
LQQERRDRAAAQEGPASGQPLETEVEDKSPSDTGRHTISLMSDGSENGSPHDQSTDSGEEDAYFSAEDDSDEQDPRINIFSPTELEELFLKVAPDLSGKQFSPFLLVWGLNLFQRVHRCEWPETNKSNRWTCWLSKCGKI